MITSCIAYKIAYNIEYIEYIKIVAKIKCIELCYYCTIIYLFIIILLNLYVYMFNIILF